MGGAFGASIDGAATQDVEAHGAVALRALTDGKMPVKCVPGRLAMTRLRLDAFPGGNPWQFFHSMYPKSGLGREGGGFVASFALHASENGLALARCARHASGMPRKSPSEDTPREDLARKGPFSLHGPLESCTARESCHPASTKHPSAHNHAAALMAAHHPQHSRCRRQPHRKRSHTPPPRDTEASGGREIPRRPSPAAPKRSSGANGTAAPHVAIWPQHPQRRWRHQARCGP